MYAAAVTTSATGGGRELDSSAAGLGSVVRHPRRHARLLPGACRRLDDGMTGADRVREQLGFHHAPAFTIWPPRRPGRRLGARSRLGYVQPGNLRYRTYGARHAGPWQQARACAVRGAEALVAYAPPQNIPNTQSALGSPWCATSGLPIP
jgi:hypothetical protein